jgi:hypothetical protein
LYYTLPEGLGSDATFATPLFRPVTPGPNRRTLRRRAMAMVERSPGSVEAMRHVLSYLLEEREQLRAKGRTAVELDANRKAIAAMEWQLEHALTVARLAPASPGLVASGNQSPDRSD